MERAQSLASAAADASGSFGRQAGAWVGHRHARAEQGVAARETALTITEEEVRKRSESEVALRLRNPSSY